MPLNVYDGSGSDGEGHFVVSEKTKPTNPEESAESNSNAEEIPEIRPGQIPFITFRLGYSPQVGEFAKDAEKFCSFQMVKTYPYSYVGNTNRKPVDEIFFANGKLYEHGWEFFYLYRESNAVAQQPIILVLTRHFNHFLAKINSFLQTKLIIPAGAKGAFELRFATHDGTPRPRYMGHAKNKDEADKLKNNIPPSHFKIEGEPEHIGRPSAASLQAFREKIGLLVQSRTGKKNSKTEKKKRERISKFQDWNNSIKRVQRYLGIRQARSSNTRKISRGELSSMPAEIGEPSLNADDMTLFNPEKLIPFIQEKSVVFVCVDVEAWEHNPNMITELGFATLDTRDLTTIVPGEAGINWVNAIRPRHFRIIEYKDCINKDYVHGCADRFEFGTSEFISLKDAPEVISSCFKFPFSKTGDNLIDDFSTRNIVLVGHDVISDVTYLRTIGFEICSIPNILETIDTALMYRYFRREMNPRNLGATIADLGIVGWNLHNAGNDAVYTLQAMISIAFKQLQSQQAGKHGNSLQRKPIINNMNRGDDIDGWSSSGDDFDGGEPEFIPPSYTGSAKTKRPMHNSNQSNGPWKSSRPVTRNVATSSVRRPTTTPPDSSRMVPQAPKAPSRDGPRFW